MVQAKPQHDILSSIRIPCKRLGVSGYLFLEENFGLKTIIKKNRKENEIGELYYSGKNVCLGYAENINDLSKGDENKGILKTGDVAKR